MKNKRVQKAASATDHIEVTLRKAEGCVAARRAINALGLYMELSAVELNIACAIEYLKSAQEALKLARREWPSDADQDDC
jgi:hypothetical protein